MDELRYLIYHFSSKNNDWYDATKNIDYLKGDTYSWYVKFNNCDEPYHISYKKMRVFRDPKEIEFDQVYYKGEFCFNVDKLLLFDNSFYKIFYTSGYTKIALKKDIKVAYDILKKDNSASKIISYYKKIANEVASNEEDKFVALQFNAMDCVDEESVLSLYLKGVLLKNPDGLTFPVVCPFGVNTSQLKALRMVFENRISVIEGPPGTGKTQTILNIIANAVMNGKSIAVVSNNNSATNNIFEKLEKYGFSFICAPLGNIDNVEKFFAEYNPEVPNIEKENISISELNNVYSQLPNFLKKENHKKKLLSALDSVNLEHKHFLVDNNSFDFSEYKLKNTKFSPSFIQNILVKIKEDKKLGWFDRSLVRRRIKIKLRSFKRNKDMLTILLQNLYYLSKIDRIEKQIKDIDKYMKFQSFDEKMQIYKNLSIAYFKNKLAEIFASKSERSYDKDNYKQSFEKFVKDYPVVLSSTYSLARCSKKGFMFDYLVVDESSQVGIASAILSMRIAKNIVVVGDIKQLPQIDDSTFSARNDKLAREFDIPEPYNYQGNSILGSILSLYKDLVPKQMLREHYRCQPDIINFCNKEFYNDELIVYTTKKENSKTMQIIKTVPGNFARKSDGEKGLYNQREIDEIEQLIAKDSMADIGIITPYRYQARLIQDKFGDRVEASTIHKFQGREKKTIIFSSVVNNVNDFVDNDNLINVAVSRAVEKFILVTSDKVANSKTGVLSDLIKYILYNQDFGEVNQGSVKSIYDILYSDYEEELERFRKRHPSKDFDTENITKELLKHIFKDIKYKGLWFKMHVWLKDFVNDCNSSFTDDEYKFYTNPKSHVDFLVYDKMSRNPVFAIEVDGVKYHEQDKKQKVRDQIKNSILSKSNIPLLRLKTNQSNEESRIIEFIDSIGYLSR